MNTRITIIACFLMIFGIPIQAQWIHTNGPRNEVPTFSTFDHCLADIGNDLFAGTDTSGVLRSTDGGSTWTAVNNGLTDLTIYALCVSGGSLLAGTGSGLFLSTDSGTNWDSLPSPFSSSSVSAIVASSSNLIVGSAGSGSILLSTNNGNSWTSTGSDSIFGVNCFSSVGTNLFAGTGGSGVWLSTDNGASWIPTDTGPAVVRSLVGVGTTVFAGTDDGMYYSNNNGENWNSINSVLTGSRIYALATSGQNLFAGTFGNGAYLSTNNGESWNAFPGNGMINPIIYSLLISNGNLYAGTYGGVFISTNNGTNWTVHNPLTSINSLINSLDTIGRSLFACTQVGLFATTDSGTIWTLDSAGMGNIAVTEVLGIGDTFFAGTSSNGLFFSTNNGASWATDTGLHVGSTINVLVQNNGVLYTSYSQAFAVIGKYQIEAGTNGIYASTDNGSDWFQVEDVPTFSIVPIYSLAVLGQNIYAGTNGYGVWLSNDSGLDWIQANDSGLNFPNVTTLLANGGKLYAGTMFGVVYVSSDSGATWIGIDSGFTVGSDVISIAIQDSNLYAGTPDSGIWRHSLSKVARPSGVVSQTPPLTSSQIQIYPNPFSQSTQITFTSPSAGYAEVSIVNMLGVEVARLFSGEVGAGEHSFQWDSQAGSPVPHGVYECLVRMNGQVETLPVVLMR